MSKGKGPDVLELVDSSDEEPPAPPRAAPLPKDDGTIDLTGLSSSESSDSGDDRPSKHQPVATSVPASVLVLDSDSDDEAPGKHETTRVAVPQSLAKYGAPVPVPKHRTLLAGPSQLVAKPAVASHSANRNAVASGSGASTSAGSGARSGSGSISRPEKVAKRKSTAPESRDPVTSASQPDARVAPVAPAADLLPNKALPAPRRPTSPSDVRMSQPPMSNVGSTTAAGPSHLEPKRADPGLKSKGEQERDEARRIQRDKEKVTADPEPGRGGHETDLRQRDAAAERERARARHHMKASDACTAPPSRHPTHEANPAGRVDKGKQVDREQAQSVGPATVGTSTKVLVAEPSIGKPSRLPPLKKNSLFVPPKPPTAQSATSYANAINRPASSAANRLVEPIAAFRPSSAHSHRPALAPAPAPTPTPTAIPALRASASAATAPSASRPDDDPLHTVRRAPPRSRSPSIEIIEPTPVPIRANPGKNVESTTGDPLTLSSRLHLAAAASKAKALPLASAAAQPTSRAQPSSTPARTASDAPSLDKAQTLNLSFDMGSSQLAKNVPATGAPSSSKDLSSFKLKPTSEAASTSLAVSVSVAKTGATSEPTPSPQLLAETIAKDVPEDPPATKPPAAKPTSDAAPLRGPALSRSVHIVEAPSESSTKDPAPSGSLAGPGDSAVGDQDELESDEEPVRAPRRWNAADKGKGRASTVEPNVPELDQIPPAPAPAAPTKPANAPLAVPASARPSHMVARKSMQNPHAKLKPHLSPAKRSHASASASFASDDEPFAAASKRQRPLVVEATATLSQVFVPGDGAGASGSLQPHLNIELRRAGRAGARASSQHRGSATLAVSADTPVMTVQGTSEDDRMAIDIEVTSGGKTEVVKLTADFTLNEINGRRVDLAETRERISEWKQVEQPLAAVQRCITGPKLEGEFSSEIQDHVNNSTRRRAERENKSVDDIQEFGWTATFDMMVYERIADEVPAHVRPTVTLFPTTTGPNQQYAPRFEFYYTNRVVYDDDVLPVQSPGCGCEGDCRESTSCACRRRQTDYCRKRTKNDGHSNREGFAYTEQGTIHLDVLDARELICECNADCGCDATCINRNVGSKKSIAVELFHTGTCGWAVRNPNTSVKSIIKGTPLSIYAGELLVRDNAWEREKVYAKVKRNYIFDLDTFYIKEALEEQQSPSATPTVLTATAASVSATVVTKAGPKAVRGKAKRKGKGGKAKRPASEAQQEQEDTGEDAYQAFYSVDAFHFGNWTRFCNHKCHGATAGVRSVYVDDGDVRRPLLIFVAVRDIAPGEEITISYWGDDDPVPDNLAAYKKAANVRREQASKDFRCYCGDEMCRGTMFQWVDAEEDSS